VTYGVVCELSFLACVGAPANLVVGERIGGACQYVLRSSSLERAIGGSVLENRSFESKAAELGISVETYRSMVRAFVQDTASQLRELESAIASDDNEVAGRAAHAIAGAAENFECIRLAEIAREVQTAARNGESSGALAQRHDQLCAQFATLAQRLELPDCG